jgi:hypothetical protein
MNHTFRGIVVLLMVAILAGGFAIPVSAEQSDDTSQAPTETQEINAAGESQTTTEITEDSAEEAKESPPATRLQKWGAFFFGTLIGWYVYYINRYRQDNISLNDLATLVGVLGGGTILAIFPGSTDLFGAYGIGLAVGFFSYFLVLLIMVHFSDNFNRDWFLDGRRKEVKLPYCIPEGTRPSGTGALKEDEKQKLKEEIIEELKRTGKGS